MCVNVCQGCCKQIEEEFLQLRGVISFTFDLPRQRCTVRCRSGLEPVVCLVFLIVWQICNRSSVLDCVHPTQLMIDYKCGAMFCSDRDFAEQLPALEA